MFKNNQISVFGLYKTVALTKLTKVIIHWQQFEDSETKQNISNK